MSIKIHIFDIETLALPESELPPFDESTVAFGNLKDPDKRAAKIAEARAEYVANAALSPMTATVAMVGFKEAQGGFTIWEAAAMDERDVVATSLALMAERLQNGDRLVGFNCLSFDLPFLIRRAWKLNLYVWPFFRTRRRYWHDDIIDLRDEWLLGERQPAKGTSSLDAAAEFLDLRDRDGNKLRKLGKGSDFAKLTDEQRRAYLTRDLEVTEALYLRLFQR